MIESLIMIQEALGNFQNNTLNEVDNRLGIILNMIEEGSDFCDIEAELINLKSIVEEGLE